MSEVSEVTVHRAIVRIPADHPTLPGHFPGRPIVPGVVLLQCVLDEAERWLGTQLSVRMLPQAKFSAPLLPEQDAELELRRTGNELRFSVMRDAQVVTQGLFTLADLIDAGRAA
jgi:3-hydroxymyristoyl/3-hydroxydecanoyl-(acyl carrier protein) dehydratase